MKKSKTLSILLIFGICIFIILDLRFMLSEFVLLNKAIADGNYQTYFSQYAGKYKSFSYSKGQAIPQFLFIQILIIVAAIASIRYFAYSFRTNKEKENNE